MSWESSPHNLAKVVSKNNLFYVAMGTKLEAANNIIGKHKVPR